MHHGRTPGARRPASPETTLTNGLHKRSTQTVLINGLHRQERSGGTAKKAIKPLLDKSSQGRACGHRLGGFCDRAGTGLVASSSQQAGDGDVLVQGFPV